MRTPTAFALGAAAAVAVPVLAALAAAVSGRLPVSALEAHTGPVEWVLETARERTVSARARAIVPPVLDEPALARRGARLYRDHCASCHGGPETPPAPFAHGLNPVSPELEYLDFTTDRPAAEAFWVIANGIRMTGMPGFEPILTDEEIWSLVAYLRTLSPDSDSASSPAARTPEPPREAAPAR